MPWSPTQKVIEQAICDMDEDFYRTCAGKGSRYGFKSKLTHPVGALLMKLPEAVLAELARDLILVFVESDKSNYLGNGCHSHVANLLEPRISQACKDAVVGWNEAEWQAYRRIAGVAPADELLGSIWKRNKGDPFLSQAQEDDLRRHLEELGVVLTVDPNLVGDDIEPENLIRLVEDPVR